MSNQLSRRCIVTGGLGAAVYAVVGLPLLLRSARGATAAPAPSASAPVQALPPGRARACIVLFMHGGPSHIDTWDPKPGRPTGGEFRAIGSSVAGIRVSEHLPLLAKRMKQLAIVRSMTSTEGNHERARHLMHTSYPPQPGVDHPAFGSVLGKSRGTKDLPPYVAVGGPGGDAGFLGGQWSPFFVPDPSQPLQHLVPARNVDAGRLDRRIALWREFEDHFIASHPSEYALGHRAIGEQAVTLMHSPATAAFDLSTAPPKQAEPYGRSTFGLSCLMARRLIEQGVPFVEVTLQGWDTHAKNFPTVKQLSQELDRGMSALLDDLAASGLLETTLVLWMGDFGRTPEINAVGGRGHYPRAFSVVLAGGGVRGGQVIGETDPDGREVARRPVKVPDLFRSLAHAVNLDPDKTEVSPTGRPLRSVERGSVIAELF